MFGTGSRLDLHNQLLLICPNVYFQPPSDIKMKYPCIVYKKTNKLRLYGSDVIHFSRQEYSITVIDKDPDTNIPDQIEEKLQYCGVDHHYTIDNLNHIVLSLYY